MKKIILSIAFIASGLVASAQVGVGNVDPKTTLDVTGATSGGAVASGDGVMVPRVTNLTAANIAAADGALVFLTVDSGADLRGFYYWDQSVPDWVAVGGAAAATFNVSALQSVSYAALATDDVIRFNNNVDVTVTLPTTGIAVGKKYYITAEGGANVVFSPTPVTIGYTGTFSGTGSTAIYIGGTNYVITSGY
jgi:hypothetical protein